MRLIEVDPWLVKVGGYGTEELLETSFYSLVHTADSAHLQQAFTQCKFATVTSHCSPVKELGQMWSRPYRLLVRGGGYCWVETRLIQA